MIPYEVAAKIDSQVNAAIAPIAAEWPDIWRDDLPAVGDCEDYSLSKRRILLDMGYDHRLMAPLLRYGTFYEPGHMRLAVSTERGWIVLDNLAAPSPYVGDVHDLLVGTQWYTVKGRPITSPFQWKAFCETRKTDPGCL